LFVFSWRNGLSISHATRAGGIPQLFFGFYFGWVFAAISSVFGGAGGLFSTG
jgi:hypothetical protein